MGDSSPAPDQSQPVVSELTPSRRNWPRVLLAIGLAAAFVGFYAMGWHERLKLENLSEDLDDLQAQVNERLPLVLLAYFSIYVAVTALSIPAAAVLTLFSGALFGRWLGTAVVSLGSTVGATLACLSSRYLLRDWVQSRFGARVVAINEGLEKDGAYYLFTLRLVPAVPFFLINIGMGLTRIPVWTFAWVSMLGMLPGTFLFVNAGTSLSSFKLSPTVVISLILLGVVPLLLRKLVRR